MDALRKGLKQSVMNVTNTHSSVVTPDDFYDRNKIKRFVEKILTNASENGHSHGRAEKPLSLKQSDQ